jgi:elongation factor Ts
VSRSPTRAPPWARRSRCVASAAWPGRSSPPTCTAPTRIHIAAYSPLFLTREDVPEDTVANERRIAEETAKNEGKPEKALPKIVEGRLNGFFKENVLLDQGFAKDPKKSVGKVLEEAGGTVTGFVRFRVGN